MEISTEAQLKVLATAVNGGESYAGCYFKLTADNITITGAGNYSGTKTATFPSRTPTRRPGTTTASTTAWRTA